MKKIMGIIGARPQFIKHAPVELALKDSFDLKTIHTGQHYDENMSNIFFEQLKMRRPDYIFALGGGSHAEQTGKMLIEIERVLINEKPDAVLVYGDTNSTLAGALAAIKIHIPVIHIEAGLRSYNKTMPEEINRVLTDSVSEFLFVPTNQGVINLEKEGITKNVYQIGDVMFDALKLAENNVRTKKYDEPFCLVTLHRPYNTDKIERLTSILGHLNRLKYKVVFTIHPRTSQILKNNNVDISSFDNIKFIEPQSYFDLIGLQKQSQLVITDSGGVQKEAYMLKKKCITLRSETEWVETLINNWNILVFDDLNLLNEAVDVLPGTYLENVYGDGTAAKRISEILLNNLESLCAE